MPSPEVGLGGGQDGIAHTYTCTHAHTLDEEGGRGQGKASRETASSRTAAFEVSPAVSLSLPHRSLAKAP